MHMKVHKGCSLHTKRGWTVAGAQKETLTFEELLIECVDALGNDDGQGGSAQQPGPQDGHQLQLLLQTDGPVQTDRRRRTALPV